MNMHAIRRQSGLVWTPDNLSGAGSEGGFGLPDNLSGAGLKELKGF